MKQSITIVTVSALALLSSLSLADNYSYVNWQNSSGNGTSETVTGVMTVGAQTINVTYTGEVSFTQLNNTGTDFYTPTSTYTGATVSNAPTQTDMIGIFGLAGNTNTITFSSPVTNPIIDLVSLGGGGTTTTYDFNTPIVILNQGAGYWGGNGTDLTVQNGDTLAGDEGSGSVQITGTFSSISWTTNNGESWNGFTFGAPQAVPEPSELMGLGAAVLGLLGFARRRKA